MVSAIFLQTKKRSKLVLTLTNWFCVGLLLSVSFSSAGSSVAARLSAATLVTSFTPAQVNNTISWSEPETVSEVLLGNAFESDVALGSSGNVHFVWMAENENGSAIRYCILYKETNAWSSVIQLSNSTKDPGLFSIFSRYPQIFIDSQDRIHVSWRESRAQMSFTNHSFNYRVFSAGAWQPEESIINNSISSKYGFVVDTVGTAHFVWGMENVMGEQLFYRKHFTNGSFSSIEQLTNTTFDSLSPSLALDSRQHIHLVWTDRPTADASFHEILYSINNGTCWSPFELVSAYIENGSSRNPVLSIHSNDTVHLIWEECDTYSLYYRSKARDENWSIIRCIGKGFNPAIALLGDSATLLLLWERLNNLHLMQVVNNSHAITYHNITNNSWFNTLFEPKIKVSSEKVIHISYCVFLEKWQVCYIKGVFVDFPAKNHLLLAILLPSVGAVAICTVVVLLVRSSKREKS